MNRSTIVVGLIGLLIFSSGCKPMSGELSRPRTSEKPEYDCRKNIDRICKVPWKDKIVLYCYKGKIPKVVRSKEEC